MWNVWTETNGIFYLMAVVGGIGILAKIISSTATRKLEYAAANMSKSNHRLMKLVRAKYEHACLAHDTVDNPEVFVEKYLREYRCVGLRLHSWQEVQRQSIWFAALLAVFGMAVWYHQQGLGEMMYRYGMTGAAEVVLLFTLFRLSNESYKLEMIRIYMVDFLENIYVHRNQRVRTYEREKLNVISPEPTSAAEGRNADARGMENRGAEHADSLAIQIEEEQRNPGVSGSDRMENGTRAERREIVRDRGENARQAVREMIKKPEQGDFLKGNAQKENVQKENVQRESIQRESMQRENVLRDGGQKESGGRVAMSEEETRRKEEAIRHILEEFLA